MSEYLKWDRIQKELQNSHKEKKEKSNGNGKIPKELIEEQNKLDEYNRKIEEENREREEIKKEKLKEEREKADKEAEEALDGESGFDADKKLIDVDWDKLKKEVESTAAPEPSDPKKPNATASPSDGKKEKITISPLFYIVDKKKIGVTAEIKGKVHQISIYPNLPDAKKVLKDIEDYVKIAGKGAYEWDSKALEVITKVNLTNISNSASWNNRNSKTDKKEKKEKKKFSMEDMECVSITEKDFENYVIPHEEISSEPITIQQLLEVFKEGLYIPEDINITIPTAFAISNFAPNDPDALVIVGPSGSGKTEVIISLGDEENQIVYPLGKLTKSLSEKYKNRIVEK